VPQVLQGAHTVSAVGLHSAFLYVLYLGRHTLP
jgi:hypothetical protein